MAVSICYLFFQSGIRQELISTAMLRLMIDYLIKVTVLLTYLLCYKNGEAFHHRKQLFYFYFPA